MPYNGSGTFAPPAADFPAVAGTTILASKFNNIINDIAAGLTTAVTKDGQTTVTANLPMATFRHTGVGNATARDHYGVVGQIQDHSYEWCGTAGGTANALTLTCVPAIAAYAAGQVFRFIAGASSNSGATTVAVSGLATRAVQVRGRALVGGEILPSQPYYIVYDGTQFQLVDDKADAGNMAEASLASAATVDLGSVATERIEVTGTTTVTSFGTSVAGLFKIVRASSGFQITHNGTSMICPDGVSLGLKAGAIVALTSLGSGNWRILWVRPGDREYKKTALSSTTTIDLTHYTAWLQCTNTITLNLTAAATLGNGWWVLVDNAGAGTVTIDPNGAETIDGATTAGVVPGEKRLVFCDGSNFVSFKAGSGLSTMQFFSGGGSYSFNAPSGTPPIFVMACGAGGGGGAGGKSTVSSTDAGGGGGGGGSSGGLRFGHFTSYGASETVTIGIGGTGAPTNTTAGTTGGTGGNGGGTTFGALLTGPGGNGGLGGTASTNGGAGGATLDTFSTAGATGGNGDVTNGGAGARGGFSLASPSGSAGSAGIGATASGGAGGNAAFGAGGGGGGGGGDGDGTTSGNGGAGGNGGDGWCLVMW